MCKVLHSNCDSYFIIFQGMVLVFILTPFSRLAQTRNRHPSDHPINATHRQGCFDKKRGGELDVPLAAFMVLKWPRLDAIRSPGAPESPGAEGSARTRHQKRGRMVEKTTISETADEALEGTGSRHDDLRSDLSPHFPLSFSQQGLWFYNQLVRDEPVYNIPTVFRIGGPLDIHALEKSLGRIIERHEALRTRFSDESGNPGQRVASSFQFRLLQLDLPGANEAELQAAIANESAKPFDLRRDLLLRGTLIRVAPEEHVLVLMTHHIAADGWSISILVKELSACYHALSRQAECQLPELPIQYVDFAVWQRDLASTAHWKSDLEYWVKKLSAPTERLLWPSSQPRQPDSLKSTAGRSLVQYPAPNLMERIETLARAEKTTPFVVLLAVLNVLLHRSTNATSIWIASPVLGRNQTETEPLMGCFANRVLFHSEVDPSMPFRSFLSSVKEEVISTLAHQDVPFELVLENLPKENPFRERNAIQVMFGFEQFGLHDLKLEGALTESIPVPLETAKWDLSLFTIRKADGVHNRWEFNSSLFDAATAERMAGHFNVLLESMLRSPDEPIGTLPTLTSAEIEQLNRWNQTTTPYPGHACIHELFEGQARAHPERACLESGNGRLSYAAVNQRANRLARTLKECGSHRGALVGVCLERGPEMIISLLAILKSGAAYVPLDPEYPQERLGLMIADTRAPIIITQSKFDSLFRALSVKRICLDQMEGASQPAVESGQDQSISSSSDDPAYVIYTSGSTGQPKGAVVTHRNVVRLVKGASYAEFGSEEVFLQAAPISFDAATFEIWGPLLNGGRLALMPPGNFSLEELAAAIRQHNISTLWLTSGLFQVMVEEQLGALAPLRQLLAGGDVLPPLHVEKFLAAHPHCRLINGYGPTENTTFTCCADLRLDEARRGLVPIGKPISNTQVYIRNQHHQPAPVGTPGELFLGGDGVAKGYLNRPELTAEKFIPDPLNPQQRLYRSGDLGRWLEDGRIEFLGRIDEQIKLRGFRIEPAEIETALCRHDGIKSAVVVCHGSGANKHLTAYCQMRNGGVSSDELKNFLLASLPDYMVPAFFIPLQTLPLSPNGKVDRRKLPPPAASVALPDQKIAPRSKLEQEIASIWSEVMGLDKLGIHDDFFDLGGASLVATKIISRLNKAYSLNVPILAIFDHSTVASLAEYIEAFQAKRA